MPLTELWLSKVSTTSRPGPNGYASPTSRHAPVALGVKITAYSSAEALTKVSTARRADSTSPADAWEVGFSECGLPKQVEVSRLAAVSICERAGSPAPA